MLKYPTKCEVVPNHTHLHNIMQISISFSRNISRERMHVRVDSPEEKLPILSNMVVATQKIQDRTEYVEPSVNANHGLTVDTVYTVHVQGKSTTRTRRCVHQLINLDVRIFVTFDLPSLSPIVFSSLSSAWRLWSQQVSSLQWNRP